MWDQRKKTRGFYPPTWQVPAKGERPLDWEAEGVLQETASGDIFSLCVGRSRVEKVQLVPSVDNLKQGMTFVS